LWTTGQAAIAQKVDRRPRLHVFGYCARGLDLWLSQPAPYSSFTATRRCPYHRVANGGATLRRLSIRSFKLGRGCTASLRRCGHRIDNPSDWRCGLVTRRAHRRHGIKRPRDAEPQIRPPFVFLTSPRRPRALPDSLALRRFFAGSARPFSHFTFITNAGTPGNHIGF
jgi:hypothetical protein